MGLGATPPTFPPGAYDVKLGTVQTSGAGGEDHAVAAVDLDPAFSAATGAADDVALLELQTPSRVTPISIAAPSERAIWEPGALATVAGFGTTSPSGSAKPAVMQVTQVPITTDSYCAAAYPPGPSNEASNDGSFDAATMVCAGWPQGGHDTCEGDSGGPLLAALPDGEQRLVGATSWGNSCAQAGYPGVYARVAQGPISAWIAGVVPSAFAAGGSPLPSPSPPIGPAPVISHLRISPTRVLAARSGPILSRASSLGPGARLTWRDSAAALAAFSVWRRSTGGTWIRVGSFSHADRPGDNAAHFSARVLRPSITLRTARGSTRLAALPPGRYRLVARASLPDGLTGPTALVRFSVRGAR